MILRLEHTQRHSQAFKKKTRHISIGNGTDTYPSTSINILLMLPNIIAASGAVRTLWSIAGIRESQKGEKFCFTVEKHFIFIASLLHTGWSPKI